MYRFSQRFRRIVHRLEPRWQSTRRKSPILTLKGTLTGHKGWVTQIATHPRYPDMILSGSRDKTLIVWDLKPGLTPREDTAAGVAKKSLRGHTHFVSDVVMSSDGQYALSGSWDSTLRLWDLNT